MANDRPETTLAVEKRTIDHIPVDERHGRGRDLFTIWFGSNIMLLTVATGVVTTAVYGLPVWAAVLSLVVGNFAGGAIGCYVAGIALQIPFLNTEMFEGPIAKALGDVDISWLIGLAVICPLYYVLMKRFPRFTGHRAEGRADPFAMEGGAA